MLKRTAADAARVPEVEVARAVGLVAAADAAAVQGVDAAVVVA